MLFQDRDDAARRLATKLAGFKGRHPLILAIPRGGVPMAAIVAAELGGEVDVVLVRKLRAPFNPELAVGSVDEDGWVYLAPHAISSGATQEYIEREKAEQLRIMRARRAQYTPLRAPINPEGRIVIVVDDGLATGATMISALHALRGRKPGKLIVAVPVSSPEALAQVRKSADEVICLEVPLHFQAVGQFYASFEPVEDEQVFAILKALGHPGA
ncbi:MAG: phosphoribosyltransferase family protein [Betaproteobacteria bacterium]|nr:phosphoribosyltransferase family protein [Betaproteobacteria bacterium]